MARDARKDLEAALGHEARDDLWLLMVEDRYSNEYESRDLDLAGLVARYRRLAVLGPRKRSTPQVREIPPDERLIARTTVLVERAGELNEVREFRERWLAGGLVQPEQLEEWIRDRRPERPAVWGTVLLGDDGQPVPGSRPRSTGMYCVSYFIPLDEWEHSAPVGADGALRELKTLSEDLGRWTGWRPSAAATFLVTGIRPILSLARVTQSRNDGPLGAYVRVILDVDPSMSPSKVAGLFRDARSDLKVKRHRRSKRPLSQLLEFVESRTDLPWPDRLAAWNAEFPSLKYDHATNMQRDYLRARRIAEEEDFDV